MDDVIVQFDPVRRRPRALERFERGPYTELFRLRVDGEVRYGRLHEGLRSVGLTIKREGPDTFVITAVS